MIIELQKEQRGVMMMMMIINDSLYTSTALLNDSLYTSTAFSFFCSWCRSCVKMLFTASIFILSFVSLLSSEEEAVDPWRKQGFLEDGTPHVIRHARAGVTDR